MIRLNLVKGLGHVLQIAEDWTVKLPDDVSDTLMERTNPTWPCTWFAPRCDGNFIATPTDISKSFITTSEKLVIINEKGEAIEGKEGYKPSSEIKMHQ